MTTNVDPIITNQQFRARWVLKGLEQEEEQFRINSGATVEVRIKSADSRVNHTGWVPLAYNSNRDDHWELSTLDIIIDAALTGQINDTTNVLVDVRVQGFFVDRDGTVTTESYDKTWSALYPVEEGLA